MKTPSTRGRRSPRRRRIAVVALAVVLLGAAAVYALWRAGGPAGEGAPRLAVDRTEADFGDVPFNRFVTAEFRLSNAGHGPLRLDVSPVRVVQGC